MPVEGHDALVNRPNRSTVFQKKHHQVSFALSGTCPEKLDRFEVEEITSR
jgi:hypothetical protein